MRPNPPVLGRNGRIATRHYAYFNARVYAMRGRLLPADTYARFLQMDIPEIARFLGETEYKKEIEDLGKRYRGVDLVEYALNRNLASTFHGLLKKAQSELRELLALYMRYYDLENITTILRGKFSGVSAEEMREALIPAGSQDLASLHKLIEAPYEDTLEMLRRTGYEFAVEMLPKRPLPEVEDEMRKQYYSSLLEATAGESKSMVLFNRFLRTEIDFLNIVNFLRLKRDDEPQERLLVYMVEGGQLLGMKRLKKLAPMGFEEVLPELEQLPYFRTSTELFSDASASLVWLETAMRKKELEYASKQGRQNPLTVLVVLSYILAKRTEVENIRKIVRGKEGNLPVELVRRQLVA